MFAPKRRRKLMEAQLFLQKSIREKLDELREKNNQFSLRAFARILKVSPASLSEFLNGKRVLSPKMLKKLAENLCLPPEDIDILDQKISELNFNNKSVYFNNSLDYAIYFLDYEDIKNNLELKKELTLSKGEEIFICIKNIKEKP